MAVVIKEIVVKTTVEPATGQEASVSPEWLEQLKEEILRELEWELHLASKRKER